MSTIKQLTDYIAKLAESGLCVAFSGGVDSSLLLKIATEVTPDTHAVMLVTAFHSADEHDFAKSLAKDMDARFKTIELELSGEVLDNPPERCYLCKKEIFTIIKKYAAGFGISTVLDGTNADDLTQYRPGLKALKELGITSPLAALGIDKSTVREMAARLGIKTANKPSAPCLATRIPYNTRIEPEILVRVDKLESYIKTFGADIVRARVHGGLVKIEVNADAIEKIAANAGQVADAAKKLGFMRAALDLEGYTSGVFDTNPH